MPTIRPSRDDDIDAITLIYAHHVLHGTGTFEVDPPSVQDMRARRAEVLARGLPWLIAESDNQVSGFAYCNWFKPRPAYRFSAEDSIYLAPHANGQGLGRALLAELATQAERRCTQADRGHRRLGQHRFDRRSSRSGFSACGRARLVRLEIRPLA